MSSYPGSEHLHGYFTLTDLEASKAVKFGHLYIQKMSKPQDLLL
jgi:hypothetical protein